MTPKRKHEQQKVSAHHEAGHAAVAWYLGLGICKRGLSIIPNQDDGSLGHCWTRAFRGNPELSNSDRVQLRAKREAMCLMAGLEAQRKYRRSSVRNYHASSDHRSAINLMVYFASPGEELNTYLRLLSIRTRRMVAFLWPQIEALAAALFEQRQISGPNARDILIWGTGGDRASTSAGSLADHTVSNQHS